MLPGRSGRRQARCQERLLRSLEGEKLLSLRIKASLPWGTDPTGETDIYTFLIKIRKKTEKSES